MSYGTHYAGRSVHGHRRYALLSGANTNGDFVGTNDLAFMFDRSSDAVPASVRTGLQTLLNNPDASLSLKNYINVYSGQVAERNGGTNGFYGILDIRALKRFRIHKNHAFEVSADVFNVANLLNKNKSVNRSLGAAVTPSGDPFQIQLGARYSF